MSSSGPTAPFQALPGQNSVENNIDGHDPDSEKELVAVGEALGVDDRQEVGFDEAARVSGAAAHDPQAIFKGRERADPSGEFDQGAPPGRREMEPREPRPFQDQEAAGHDKQDEGEMKDHDGIGKKAMDHPRPRKSPRTGSGPLIASRTFMNGSMAFTLAPRTHL